MKRIVSGIQPTGDLNIAGYLGAVKNFIKLQKELEDYEFFIFIADLHSITTKRDKLELRKKIRQLAALYLACGLDKEKTTLFIQSEVASHSQLAYILQCNTYIGECERMTQFKDKSKKQESGITVALFTYPVLMAADILIYDPDIVPVGEDQKQHLELTRDIAIRFNKRYGEDSFTIPKPLIAKVGARIMSLTEPTKKMSKSDLNPKSRISLLDPENIIRKRISSAVTDSEGSIRYDKKNKPGVANLMTIYSTITNNSFETIENKYSNLGYKEFKNDLADIIVKELLPIQEKYNELIGSKELDEILDRGAKRANQVAYKKIMKINNKVGLGRKRK